MEDQVDTSDPKVDDYGIPLKKQSSIDEFGIPVKKKENTFDSQNTSNVSPTGLNSFQNILTGTELKPNTPLYSPIIDTKTLSDNIINNAKGMGQVAKQQIPIAPEKQKRGFLDQIEQGAYLPAFNQGFNDLVVKPAAGATDFIDRTIDKIYHGLTGNKTPDWLRKSGTFDKVADYYDKAYQERDKPSNIVSETAESVIGTLPLMASMATGAGEANLAAQTPKLVSNLTKMLATTKAATAYKDATDQNESYLESLNSAAAGAAKGATEGLTMEAQMLVGGALGKGVANKLAEKGLLKGGKVGEAILHALGVGTVFGGTSAGQDLLNGKDLDTHEAMKQFGMGLAFEMPGVAKGLRTEAKDLIDNKKINDQALQTAAVSNAASNLHAESVLRTLTDTPTEQLQAIDTNIKDGHEDLYADSIEQGIKAYDAKSPEEKKQLYASQLLLKTQGDVKFLSDKLADPATKEDVLKQIAENDELPDEQKVQLTEKINALSKPQTEKIPLPEAPLPGESNEVPPVAMEAGSGDIIEKTNEDNTPLKPIENESGNQENSNSEEIGQAGSESSSKGSDEKIVSDEKGNVVEPGAEESAPVAKPRFQIKQGKIIPLPIEEHAEANSLLKEHGITLTDIKNEQKDRNSRSEETPPAGTDAKSVQQAGDDGTGNAGADRPGEKVQNEDLKVTGIKKAIAENTRLMNKLPEVQLSKLGTDSEILARGKKSVEEGKINPTDIVDRVVAKGEGAHYDLDEAEAMQYYSHQLAAKEKALGEQLTDVKEELSKDPNNKEVQDAKILIESNRQQLNDMIAKKYIADRLHQNFWGKSGNLLQIEADQSFSPANVRSVIADNYGGVIPKDVEERLKKAETERDEALSDLKKAQDAAIARNGKKVVEKIKGTVERRGIIKQSKAELEAEAKELLADLKKSLKKDYARINSGIPIPTETLAVLGKLAVNYFKQGIKDFEGLANKIYDDLKDDVEGLDKKQVRQYLSDYEPLREASKERTVELLDRKEKSINKQLETGKIRDYSVKPKITFKKDNEVIKAEQRVAAAEYKLKQEKEKSYTASSNKYQRALAWIVRWERRAILASPLTLEKLASAATIGSAIARVPKQIIGGAFSAIFKGLANKAPIEGGLNMSAELKFWKEFGDLKQLAKSSKEILKTGASPLTKQFTDRTYDHHIGFDAMMDTHAIIKDPPKRATFEASKRYAYEWAAKNGLDYQDPLVKRSLDLAAYKRAEYEIFQENSGIAKRVNDFLNSEKKRDNKEATKKFLLRFLVPISTVPLNIARRIGSSIIGLPRGLYLTHEAYKKGIDNLTPEQADYVMRQLKNGSVGAAYFAIGMFSSKAIMGGVWNKDDKKGKRSTPYRAAFNEMKPLGVSIDKRIQHAMPLYIMQLGATTARIYNHYQRVPTHDEEYQKMLKSTIKAMAGTAGAVVDEIPIITEPITAVEALSDPYERDKFAEDLKRRLGVNALDDWGITEKDKKKKKH